MNNFFKTIVRFLLKWFAKIYLWRSKPEVIVIAGTVGRHWIKEAVVEALKENNFSVRANEKNFNAEIGLPLSVLGLESGKGNFRGWLKILRLALKKAFGPRESVRLVLEMAIDRPRDISYLLSIVRPKIAVFTAITMVYRENFESLDEIAAEYERLIRALPWNGLAILNSDDERVKNLAKVSRRRIITYGFNKEADFCVRSCKKTVDGQELKLQINHPKKIAEVKIKRFGNHHVYAALVREIIKENNGVPASELFSRISQEKTKTPLILWD